jgi:hypothetical protein
MEGSVNGFLLFSVHNLDDVPVQFFHTKEGALEAAKSRKPPKNNPLGASDQSGFIGWKVLEFKDGKPVPYAEFIEP